MYVVYGSTSGRRSLSPPPPIKRRVVDTDDWQSWQGVPRANCRCPLPPPPPSRAAMIPDQHVGRGMNLVILHVPIARLRNTFNHFTFSLLCVLAKCLATGS